MDHIVLPQHETDTAPAAKHVTAARNIKRMFTGNLNAKVCTYAHPEERDSERGREIWRKKLKIARVHTLIH